MPIPLKSKYHPLMRLERYKVKNIYPDSVFPMDAIVEQDFEEPEIFYYTDPLGSKWSIETPWNYPAIFKKLPWYSDRIIADLPEYVLWSEDSDQEVSKVTEWSDKHSGVYALINGGLVHPGTSSLLPSTKEEYETYLSNKHKQKK